MSNVPLKHDGYKVCKKRARKDRILREGEDKVEKEISEQGDGWRFTWWEGLDVSRKFATIATNKAGEGKWEEPKVDAMGNVRLVLKGFEV